MSVESNIQSNENNYLKRLIDFVNSTNSTRDLADLLTAADRFLQALGSFPHTYTLLLSSDVPLAWHAIRDDMQLLVPLDNHLAISKHKQSIQDLLTPKVATQALEKGIQDILSLCTQKIIKHCNVVLLFYDTGKCMGALLSIDIDRSRSSFEDKKSQLLLFSYTLANQINQLNKRIEIDRQVKQKNHFLKRDIKEKEQSEQLKNALYKITALTHQHLNLQQLYKAIHNIIFSLLHANNIGIIRYREAEQMLDYDYVIDPKDQALISANSLPFGHGLTSYVIRERKAQFFTQQRVADKVAGGSLDKVLGDSSFTTWIGAPMITEDVIYGVIYLQSYNNEPLYTAHDLDLLLFVASHVASAINITQQKDKNLIEQSNIQQQHDLLQDNNLQLEKALSLLHLTEQKLIEKEKQTTLADLFVGVANEVAVPLAESSINASEINRLDKDFFTIYQEKKLTQKKLLAYVKSVQYSESLLLKVLNKTANFVENFKRISVERSVNAIRKFQLNLFIQETIQNLIGENMILSEQVFCEFDDEIQVYTDIEALKDILKQLILNSVVHGFKNNQVGKIKIHTHLSPDKSSIQFIYADSGTGMNEEDLKRIFDPYFVAKKSGLTDANKGSGLGTNLIFNLVTSSLKGELSVSSPANSGLQYDITFPSFLR